MEQLDLTTPVVVTTSAYKVDQVHERWTAQRITIVLIAPPAPALIIEYTGIEARDMMIAGNKSNNTVKSRDKRIMEKLIADGKLAGTISGTVD